MKILFVLEHYYPHIGGVEILFQHLAEGLVKRGHSVTVLTSCEKGAQKKELFHNVYVWRIELPLKGRRYWFTFLAFFHLLRIIKEYDFLHTTTYNAALPAWVAAKIYRKKIILTVHEIWGDLWGSIKGMSKITSSLHKNFERMLMKLNFDYYITDSDYTRQAIASIEKKKKRKISRVYPGIDYDFFDKNKYLKSDTSFFKGKHGSFICLYYGRPGWAKGLSFLIQAFVEVVKQIPEAKLILILSKEPHSRFLAVVEQIYSLKLGNVVELIPSVARNELPRYILEANCVIVPSISEGFGFTAAEASAMGTPLVISKAGSLPEVVSGKVVYSEPGNSTSLAHAIITMHQGKYQTIPEKKFLWENTIEQYDKIYSEICQIE